MSTQTTDQGGGTRSFVDRLVGVAVTLGVFAKFFAFFVSFAAYSIWFHSWKFGLGLVLLILVHELGHFFEARRQGLQVTLPTFIPGFGAFVTHRQATTPWRSAYIALAGPFVGGLGAAAVWAVGSARDSALLVVLANIGFLLNASNLLPIWILDGATIVQSMSLTRRGWIRYENGVPVEAMPPDREHANLVLLLYVLLGVALVGGLLATRHSGML
jgi:Zn-dependent protease